jgi:hypothetical protein
MSPVSFLDRYFDPITQVMTPELARKLIELRPDPVLSARVSELGEKSDAGMLTEEEYVEFKVLADAGTLVSLLKAKARRFLTQFPS